MWYQSSFYRNILYFSPLSELIKPCSKIFIGWPPAPFGGPFRLNHGGESTSLFLTQFWEETGENFP